MPENTSKGSTRESRSSSNSNKKTWFDNLVDGTPSKKRLNANFQETGRALTEVNEAAPNEEHDNQASKEKKLQLAKEQKEKEDREQEEIHLQEVIRLGKPFWLAKFFVRCPCLVILICWVFFLLCIGLTVGMNLMALEDQHARDLLVWDDERVITFDMLTEAKELMSEIQAKTSVSLRTF